MTDLMVIAEDLGGSALSKAVRAGTLSPHWVPPTPRGADAWRARATAVTSDFAGVDWLSRLGDAFSATGPARERLERVWRGGGVLVTTGQQPGLFGGALLTLVKAISARALADAIERETGIPTAPVFWAATDDADFPEAARVWTMTSHGATELALEHAPPPGTPMANAPLDAGDLARLFPAINDAAGSASDPDALDLVRRCYVPGATVGSAYVEMLRSLLAPLEMAVIDASHPTLQRESRGLMAAAVSRASDVAAALHARNTALREAGYELQVDEVASLSLVFANDGGGKQRVPVADARRVIDDKAVLSPTVLLRPVLERAILPTVAYVGGPAEVAYFAQASAAATALGQAVPLAVPRWSMTILEPRVARILERLGIEQHELRDRDVLTSRLAKTRLPESIATALEGLRRGLEPGIAGLREADAGGLVSPRSVEGTAQGILARIARLERRYVAATKRRETDLLRDIAVAADSLYPGGVRQERRHSYVPHLARYGPGLVDLMIEGAAAHARALVGTAPVHSVPAAAVSSSR